MSETLPPGRVPGHPVDALFVRRWSPRAMSGEAISPGQMDRLFEAARWAPSSYNGQPWRFLYARRDTPPWAMFLGLLNEFNRSWASRAGALIAITSRTTFEHNGQPARTHSFDTGSAWAMLALQGTVMGLVVHGMQGFDYDRTRAELRVPSDMDVEAMVAVGHPGRIEDLPESLRAREQPSLRKPVAEIALEGGFPG